MGVPYIVKEFEGVKVGVIGMDTPNIPAWEVESHYEGIDFRNLVPTVEHFVPILREQEGCDVVIAWRTPAWKTLFLPMATTPRTTKTRFAQ